MAALDVSTQGHHLHVPAEFQQRRRLVKGGRIEVCLLSADWAKIWRTVVTHGGKTTSAQMSSQSAL